MNNSNTANSFKVFTNSLQVAQEFGRKHSNILRDIRHLDCSQEFKRLHFQLSSYRSEKRGKKPVYLMTKQGFVFFVLRFKDENDVAIREALFKKYNIRIIKAQQKKHDNDSDMPSPVIFDNKAYDAYATTINNSIICNRNLSNKAFKVFCVFSMLAEKLNTNRINISIQESASISGITKATTHVAINELLNLGFLERIQKHTTHKNIWGTIPSIYVIHGMNSDIDN